MIRREYRPTLGHWSLPILLQNQLCHHNTLHVFNQAIAQANSNFLAVLQATQKQARSSVCDRTVFKKFEDYLMNDRKLIKCYFKKKQLYVKQKFKLFSCFGFLNVRDCCCVCQTAYLEVGILGFLMVRSTPHSYILQAQSK